MPQKRNPVAIEHARSVGSRALGEALGVIQVVHNTPFGDIVDTEDDLQPVVFSAFRDATRAIRLLDAAVRTVEFDVRTLEDRASRGWITLTELADTLVRDHAVSFKTAHEIASRLQHVAETGGRPLADALAEVSEQVTGTPVRYSESDLARILSPRHFVEVRSARGGPAPEETKRALEEAGIALEADTRWTAGARASLAAAAARLRDRSARL
jgi:argininosuccinate lyase